MITTVSLLHFFNALSVSEGSKPTRTSASPSEMVCAPAVSKQHRRFHDPSPLGHAVNFAHPNGDIRNERSFPQDTRCQKVSLSANGHHDQSYRVHFSFPRLCSIKRRRVEVRGLARDKLFYRNYRVFRADLRAYRTPRTQPCIYLNLSLFHVKGRTAQLVDTVPMVFAPVADSESAFALNF